MQRRFSQAHKANSNGGGQLPWYRHESNPNDDKKQGKSIKISNKALKVLALSVFSCLVFVVLLGTCRTPHKNEHFSQMVLFDHEQGVVTRLHRAPLEILTSENITVPAQSSNEVLVVQTTESEEEKDDNECVFQKPPPLQNLGACNNVHEIDMMPKEGHFVFVHAGGQRDVFKLTDPASGPSHFALKKSR